MKSTKSNDVSMKFIARHDGKAWRGYMVKVPGHKSKLFSRAVFGTWKRALQMATVWRNTLVKLNAAIDSAKVGK